MRHYSLSHTQGVLFEELWRIIADFCIERGYRAGPEYAGCGERDRSKESWNFEYVDGNGKRVLLFSYDNLQGQTIYRGVLEMNLSENEESELEKRIKKPLENVWQKEVRSFC